MVRQMASINIIKTPNKMVGIPSTFAVGQNNQAWIGTPTQLELHRLQLMNNG